MATKNYQRGSTGRKRGSTSITFKARVVGKGTDALHARCDPGEPGKLCAFIREAFKAMDEKLAEFSETDEQNAEARRDAANRRKRERAEKKTKKSK